MFVELLKVRNGVATHRQVFGDLLAQLRYFPGLPLSGHVDGRLKKLPLIQLFRDQLVPLFLVAEIAL